MKNRNETSYESNLSGLIWKGVFIILILAGLLVLNSNMPGIPISSSSLVQKEKQLNQKTLEINKMSRQIEVMRSKEPQFRNSMEEMMASDTGIFQDKKKERIVEIPSMLVYLEQVGKDSGVTIRKIDIAGLENKSQKSEEKDGSKKAENTSEVSKKPVAGRTEFIITGTGSYDSFASYIKELQINTKEQIDIVDFDISPSDKSLNYCEIMLRISL